MEEIIAGHIQDERVQSLTDHLDGTMRLAESFGAGMGLGTEAGLLGKIHDKGKDTPAFQDYIYGRKQSRVDHSTAGAKSFFERLCHNKWLIFDEKYRIIIVRNSTTEGGNWICLLSKTH